MQNSIILKIPSDLNCFELIAITIHKLSQKVYFSKQDEQNLISAAKELIENSVIHGYKTHQGFIEISFHPFEYGLRIDIKDWGLPMSAQKPTAVPIDLKVDKGFNRVYNLVDTFKYLNLGKEGKQFTILKYASHPHAPKPTNEKQHKYIHKTLKIKPKTLEVRDFKEGDEEAIARLIYENYGHSYIKDLFYYPKQILEYHGTKFFSTVALVGGEIVGHFALTKMPNANIAEIGIVVVDPKYQGQGIMNEMFDHLIKHAQALKLDAIFGEAMMYHTFSQKSNLSHGFKESAMLIGKVPAAVAIEQNLLTKNFLRGSLLVGYKIFNHTTKKCYLPTQYKTIILKTYENLGLKFKPNTKIKPKHKKESHLHYIYEPLAEVAVVTVERYGKHFEHKFKQILHQLRAKHCHMIYADICLEKNPKIDKIITILNKHRFFYSGILFLQYNNRDYLRLQNKHSDIIGKKNLQCYTSFCTSLLRYIQKDEKRVKKL
ncbi:MAG: GNAT family N-acetyltransferase [Epsilonproteobacteria bacterium]|nr:GNAT family N-acetyltransferase [Campylobacterota bacterium]